MSDFPRWKYALVAIVLALGLLYAAPNVFRPQPAVQVSANRGGAVDAALQKKVEDTLGESKIPYQDVAIQGDGFFEIGEGNPTGPASALNPTMYTRAGNFSVSTSRWMESAFKGLRTSCRRLSISVGTAP